jgi:penicillin-binding protein 1A
MPEDRDRSAWSEALARIGGQLANVGRGAIKRRGTVRECRKSRLAALLRLAGAVAIVAPVAFASAMLWAVHSIPVDGGVSEPSEPSVVLEAADGEALGRRGPLKLAQVQLNDFPEHLVAAVLAIEDRRFYQHRGVDLRGILRATRRNLAAGKLVEGGSTITQQLVKLLHLDHERTLERKVREALLAIWLEMRLGKDEILTRYLNTIYLGSGAYGMPAAARIYFDKEVSDLTLSEAAILAGIIKAPSVLNPAQDLAAASERAAMVLQAMVESEAITPESATQAMAQPASFTPPASSAAAGGWFADWIVNEASRLPGSSAGTLRVRTSLQPDLQMLAESVTRDALAAHGDRGATQVALVAMRPDGAVVAMVGGRDYRESQFNRAVQAQRQPGSIFKLFVYFAALRNGFALHDTIEDAQLDVDGWTPSNFDGRYHGRVTLAEAFARSLNAATVRLALEVGIDEVIAAARDLGIDAPLPEYPSVALGTVEMNLLELTAAYASVLAGTIPVEPWGIATFGTEGSDRLLTAGPPDRPTQPLGRHQRPLFELLQLVVASGTGRAASLDGFAAGKTGTSQNFRDAWFIGFDETLVVGIWAGNDDDRPMEEVTGGSLPAQIWKAFMSEAGRLIAERGAPSSDPFEELPPVRGPEPFPDDDELRISSPTDVPAFARGLEAFAGQATVSNSVVDSSEWLVEEPGLAWCNYDACATRYRSFRPSDCTFEPYRGPRRLCEIAVESARAPLASVTMITPALPATGTAPLQQQACNIAACSRNYRSFRASDCTYQPYRGPRRMCPILGQSAGAAPSTAPLATPQCNIAACSRAYKSFRVSDCTFQPHRGPRRLCQR